MRRKEIPLPKTRKEQLKYILSYRKLDIFLMSIFVTLFSLPILLWLIACNYAPIFKENNIFNVLVVYGVMMLLFPIVGWGVGGACYSLRRMILGEGSNIRHDFFPGIKLTFKPFSIVFLIFGFINLVVHVNLFYCGSIDNKWLGALFSGLCYVISFFLTIVFSYVLAQTLIYSSSVKQLIFTGFKFMMGKIVPNIGLFILILLPYFLIDFIQIMAFITVFILLLGYTGLMLLLFNIYAFYLFDEYINKDLYQENYHMGLMKDEDNQNNAE